MHEEILVHLLRIERKLDLLLTETIHIMATQKELAAAIDAANEKLKKIGTETTTLLGKIDDLQKQIASNPVSPELQAAVDALVAQAQVVDDLVPDAPVTP